jgi:hypothetical protein
LKKHAEKDEEENKSVNGNTVKTKESNIRTKKEERTGVKSQQRRNQEMG